MAYALSIGFRVEDYAKWKADFDGAEPLRKESGQGAYQIFHTHDDPDSFVILVEWESVETARAFLESEEMQELNRCNGVTQTGELLYLVEVDKGTLD